MLNFHNLLVIVDRVCALLIIDGVRTLILLYLEFNQRFLTDFTLPVGFHLGFAAYLHSSILLNIPLSELIFPALCGKAAAIELITFGPPADLELNALLLLPRIPLLLLQ